MNYDAIRSLIETELLSIADLPPLTVENVRADAIGIQPFSRGTLLPAQPLPLTVGYGRQIKYQGLYQLDLFYPTDMGTTDSNSMAALVISKFPSGRILTSSGISLNIDLAWQQSAQRIQDSWYMLPVQIQWSAYQ